MELGLARGGCTCLGVCVQSFCPIMLALNLIDSKVVAKQRKQKQKNSEKRMQRESREELVGSMEEGESEVL